MKRMEKNVVVAAGVALVALSSACESRYDVAVAWTLDGENAADACASFAAPSISFRIDNRDSDTGPVIEETETATCKAGQATIQSGAFSSLFVTLLEDTGGKGQGDVFGSAPRIDLSPGAPTGSYAGHAGDPILADIHLSRGKLHVRLTVDGKDCRDAGASDFSVSVRDNSSPLGEDVIVDGKTVSCDASSGVAAFDFEPIDNGSRYDVVASTTIGSTQYQTSADGIGAGAVAAGAVTNIVADLSPVQ